MKRKILAYFFIFNFFVVLSFSLTYKEALNIAFEKNPDLKSMKEAVKEAEFNIKKSSSLFLPTLDINGRYTRIGVIPEFEIPGMGSFKFGTPNNYDFRLTSQYLLFDWNRRKNIKRISEKGKELKENSYISMRKRVAYTIAALFYTYDILKESKVIFEENLETLRAHLKIVKKRYDAGLVSSYDVLSTKVQISKVEAQLIDFEKGLENLKVSLKQILGIDKEVNFEGSLELPKIGFELSELLKMSLDNREELKSLMLQKSLIDLNIKIAKTSLMPQLALQANYQLRNGMLPDVDEMRSNWNINLLLSFRVFDGFNSKYERKILETQKKEIEFKIKSITKSIKADLEKAIINIESLKKSLKKEKEKLKLAEEAYSTVLKAYREGAVSNIDVLNANSNLKFAKLSVLKIKNQILQEKLKIFNIIGFEFWRAK